MKLPQKDFRSIKILQSGEPKPGPKPRLLSSTRDVDIQTLNPKTFDEILEDSRNFLKNRKHMQNSEKFLRIEKLGSTWRQIWFSADDNDSLAFDASCTLTANNLEGAEMMDEMMNILLDMFEEESKDSFTPNPFVNLNVGEFRLILLSSLVSWGLVKTTESGVRAQNLLYRMQKISKLHPHLRGLMPTTICFGATMKALVEMIDSTDQNGALEARKLLEYQSKLFSSGKNPISQPDDHHYSILMHGYATRGMVAEAESLLEGLEKRTIYAESMKGETFYSTPNVIMYSSCMNAYLKMKGRLKGRNAANRAEDLLYRLYKKYEESGDTLFMPNHVTFGTGMYKRILI